MDCPVLFVVISIVDLWTNESFFGSPYSSIRMPSTRKQFVYGIPTDEGAQPANNEPRTVAALAPVMSLTVLAAGCSHPRRRSICADPSMGWGLKGAPATILADAPLFSALLCFQQVVCFGRWPRDVQEVRELPLGAGAGAPADGAGDGSGSDAGLRFSSLGSLLGKQPTSRLIRF